MQKDKILELLSDFVAIQSVSTDPSRKDQINEAVEFLMEELKNMGFRIKMFKKGSAPPLIIASLIQSKNGKTIGIYGHYDVQPEDPVEEWESLPYELTKRSGRLYGRGVADDKGHVIQNMVAISELIQSERLKNNIVFILEGEEELGSVHFEEYAGQAEHLLKGVDCFFVIDTGMHAKNIPQIEYGLRGLLYFELLVEIGKRDLHSGVYGNRVHNPIQLLSYLMAKMKDEKNGKIIIPHFYDQVKPISTNERKILGATARTDREEQDETQTYAVISCDSQNPSLSSKIYPSMEVNGIVGGYTGEGTKTVIPHRASVKFSFRLVPDQDPYQIEKLIEEFIKNNLPIGIKYALKGYEKTPAFYTNLNNEYIQKTAVILSEVFGHKTLFNRSGGSIHAAGTLQKLFKKPIVLTGFTLPDDNIHSPNENFDEEMFFKGIEALKKIYGS